MVIENITVGGFQVFAAETHFEVAPLTLLYGPNSAGKSGLEDALRFIAAFFGLHSMLGGKLDASNRVVSPELPRGRLFRRRPDWRIDELGVSSPSLHVSVSFKADYRDYWGGLVNDLGSEYFASLQDDQERSASIRVDVTLTSYCGDLLPDVEFERMVYTVHANNELLLSAEGGGSVRINLASDFLRPTGIDLPECKALADACPDMVSVNGGVIDLAELGFGMGYLGEEPWISAEFAYGLFLDGWRSNKKDEPPRVYPAYAEAARLYNSITKNLVFELLRGFAEGTGLVPASRKVPDDEELTFLVGETNLSGLAAKSDPAFRDLAHSLAAKVAWREFAPDAVEPSSCHLINRVNECLAGPLFRERGYFLDADFNVLLDARTYKELIAHENVDQSAERPDMVLTIRLRDAHRRALSLGDVGSGIGYSLPVLNAVWSKRLSVVQQPELHLHPALQSSMADVLIEALSEGHRLIVETHSEHLLLRILRRIRDSNRIPSVPKELRLSPTDVAVYYFDPQPDGSTTVKRLRISPEGEFLDRWPRCFFIELDQDVFDE